MSLELRSEYREDPRARGSFKEFILQIHGLDFTEWEAAGYWDTAYTPFSFFDGDRVVASVCLYLLDAVIHGEAARVAQISGVGTLPEWRRRGLNRELTDRALEWARGRQSGVFLFADEEAIPFYERCGFRPIEEYVETVVAAPVAKRSGIVQLDPGRRRDRDRIYQYATRRAAVSDRFSVINSRLLLFHAMYRLRDHVFEIPSLDCLVFCQRTDDRLRIFDVVGERISRFEELAPYVAEESDRIIEFHFHADKLGLDGIRAEPLLGNHPFVMGTFPVEDPVFPFTARA